MESQAKEVYISKIKLYPGRICEKLHAARPPFPGILRSSTPDGYEHADHRTTQLVIL